MSRVNVDFITKVVEVEINDTEAESLAAAAAVISAKRAEEAADIAENGLSSKVIHNTLYKVDKPMTDLGEPDNGINGQILRTKGNGNTEWIDLGVPTDEQVESVMTNWLDEHPEATTTVEDGSLTRAKFAAALDYGTGIIFQNVHQMIADTTLKVGHTVMTKGYYTPNDGGGATYNIRAAEAGDVDDGGSIISLDNGNVAELITDGTVNVKQFGAKGDGVTDDTTSIYNAIQSHNTIGTMIVTIPKSTGEYIFTSIHVLSYMTLQGTGGTLKYKDNTATDSTASYYLLHNLGETNVTYRDLIIDGNGTNNTSFTVCDCISALGDKTIVENCTITDAPDSGIMFSAVKNGRCDNNIITGCRDCGIYVNSGVLDNLRDCTIRGNKISNCSLGSGIAVKRICSKLVISENVIYDSTNGITMENASTDSDFSTDVSINSNFLHGVSNFGIGVRGGKNHTICGNTIIGSNSFSISIAGCVNVSVTGNVIETGSTASTVNVSVISIGPRGNIVTKSSNIIICGNTIKMGYANPVFQIGLPTEQTGTYENIIISNNTATNISGMIFRQYATTISKTIISNNTFSSADGNYNHVINLGADSADIVVCNNIGDCELFGSRAKTAITLQMINETGLYQRAHYVRILNPVRVPSNMYASTYKKGDIIPVANASSGTILYYATADGIGSDVLTALVTI